MILQQNMEYARIVKEMEAENEELLDEAGSKEVWHQCTETGAVIWHHAQGDVSNAARRAKAELEVKCRELEDQACHLLDRTINVHDNILSG